VIGTVGKGTGVKVKWADGYVGGVTSNAIEIVKKAPAEAK
jgi:hypothetical protein